MNTHTEVCVHVKLQSRHTRDTRAHARAHTGTRISHRRTSQPSKPTNTPARQGDDRNRGRLNSRSPGADRSPWPTQKRPPLGRPQRTRPCRRSAAARSQSASPRRPRLLKGGRRNEGARSTDAYAGPYGCGLRGETDLGERSGYGTQYTEVREPTVILQ